MWVVRVGGDDGNVRPTYVTLQETETVESDRQIGGDAIALGGCGAERLEAFGEHLQSLRLINFIWHNEFSDKC